MSRAHTHRPYSEALDATGLDSARIGVLRHITDSDTADPAVIGLFEQALADIVAQNGVVLDPVELEGLAELQASHRNDGRCQQFKFDLNAYLAGHSPRVPVTTLEEIIESGRFHPSIRERLVSNQAADLAPPDNPACTARDAFREKLREIVLGAMDAGDLTALVYPTWNNPPRLIGDLNTPHGDNNQLLAPSTGFPAITVPMGYVDERLPTGLQFLGRPWDEFTLIRLAYAYEQATGHRRPAPTTPPLPIEPVTDEPR